MEVRGLDVLREARPEHADPALLRGDHQGRVVDRKDLRGRALAVEGHVHPELVVLAGEDAPAHVVPILVQEQDLAQGLGLPRGRRRRAAAPRVAGVEQALSGARHLAPVLVGEAPAGVVGVLVDAADLHLAAHVAAARLVAHHGPGPGEGDLAAVDLPGLPLGREQPLALGQLAEDAVRLVGSAPVLHLFPALRGLVRREGLPVDLLAAATAPAEGLEVGQGKEGQVRGLEQLPLLRVAALAQHAPEGVALGAALAQLLVVLFLAPVDAALDSVVGALGLRPRQAVVVGEVAHDVPCFFRGDDDAVQADHALEGELPALGALAHVRDAAHQAVLVGLVALGAAGAHELVGDRDAASVLLGLLGSLSTPGAAVPALGGLGLGVLGVGVLGVGLLGVGLLGVPFSRTFGGGLAFLFGVALGGVLRLPLAAGLLRVRRRRARVGAEHGAAEVHELRPGEPRGSEQGGARIGSDRRSILCRRLAHVTA